MTFDIEREGGAFRWPDDKPLPEGTKDGERRLETEQEKGGWARLTSVRGLAVMSVALDNTECYVSTQTYRVLGDRNLLSFRESGYQLEGRVSIDGEKRSAFTGSILVIKKDETGKDKLYDLACLHVRT
jgi:hypothetical protein